jgi:DNA-binding LacI/PurR family transcriptional regulator
VNLKIYEAGQEAGRLLLKQIDSPGEICSIQMDQFIVEGLSVRSIEAEE